MEEESRPWIVPPAVPTLWSDMTSTYLPLAALLASLSLACQSAKHDVSANSEVGSLVAHGEFRKAVERAAQLVENAPDDKNAQEAHRGASIAFLLEQGRRATFEGRDEEALELFHAAEALDPEVDQSVNWIDKTRRKLGLSWYIKARDLHIEEQLEAARDGYERSLELDSTLDIARGGLARVLIQINYRAGLGDDYYVDGVRALHEYWLQVARSRFQYSDKYSQYGEGNLQAARRVGEVDRLLSQRRMAVARALEADSLYHASRNEYRLAVLLDPDSAEAEEGRARTEIEAQALRMSEGAEMMILRGDFARARGLIEEGLALTVEQKDVFKDKLADIDDARAQVKYELALDLERDFRYVEAIRVYTELLDEREWFEDARSRLTTLEDYVDHAAALYRRAQGASSQAERVSMLRQIESFWPEYRDTHELLETLDPGGE
ncbi:MAG: tetratricopeptide (TPR) repeat protein [Chlamydiales bacterium]|jgi:tetratricopeptide (TPR) repeat protein